MEAGWERSELLLIVAIILHIPIIFTMFALSFKNGENVWSGLPTVGKIFNI